MLSHVSDALEFDLVPMVSREVGRAAFIVRF